MKEYQIGDLVRYGSGPTALMRITHVSKDHGRIGSTRYYGRAFHSEGPCTGSYDVDLTDPSELDKKRWAACHDADDKWIVGAW